MSKLLPLFHKVISLIGILSQSSRNMLLKQGGGALSPFFSIILNRFDNALLPVCVEYWNSDCYTSWLLVEEIELNGLRI